MASRNALTELVTYLSVTSATTLRDLIELLGQLTTTSLYDILSRSHELVANELYPRQVMARSEVGRAPISLHRTAKTLLPPYREAVWGDDADERESLIQGILSNYIQLGNIQYEISRLRTEIAQRQAAAIEDNSHSRNLGG